MGFILGRQMIAKAQSLEYSTVLRISKRQVERIIMNNTKDKETFFEIRDRLIYSNDFSHLFIECDYCQSKKHMSQDCYLLHFDKRNSFIHFKNNYSSQQIRNLVTLERRKQKCLNALKLHEFIIQNIEELRSNYGLETSQQIENSELNLLEPSLLAKIAIKKRDQSDSRGDSENNQSLQDDKNSNENSILLDENDYENNEGSDLFESENNASYKKRKKKNLIKDKFDILKQHKSLKDLLLKKEDDHSQPQKQKQQQKNNQFPSFFEVLAEDHNQQNQGQIGITSDHNKSNQQSQYNLKLNDINVPSNKLLQTINRSQTKPNNYERDEEQFTYNIVDDEVTSKRLIQGLPSNILQKGNLIYFDEANSPSMITSAQQYPPHEIVPKKQSTPHQPCHKKSSLKKKNYTQIISINLEKQNIPMTTSQQHQRKKKNSIQNSNSLNHASSLVPSLSVKETRSHIGSKKDISHQKIKVKLTTQNSGYQPSMRLDNEIKKVITNLFEQEEDLFQEDFSEKHINKQQQHHNDSDKLFYWYFDRMHNYQYYFWSCNSDNQIKKYNLYYQQKQGKQKRIPCYPKIKRIPISHI